MWLVSTEVLYAIIAYAYINPFIIGTLKPQSNGPLYTNTVIGTLAVDGWAITFDATRRGLGGLRSCPVNSSLYQMQHPSTASVPTWYHPMCAL